MPISPDALSALDADARARYLRHDFEASPTDRLHLTILIKDIEAALGEAAHTE